MTKITLIMIINSENYHEKTIQNILKNTVYDFELIWIKNYSSKKEINIKDSRVTIKELDDNNLMQTLNNTIPETKGKYIIFTNSLNILLDDTLKRGYNKLEENKADILIFSKKTRESTIISRITQNKAFDIKKIKEFVFTTNYSLQDMLYDKNFLINKNLQFNPEKNNDSNLFAYKSLLNTDKILLYNKPLNVPEKTNEMSIKEYDEYLESLKDIQELFYNEEDTILKNEANNYLIDKSIKQYNIIENKDKKEAYHILKQYYTKLLNNEQITEFIETLNPENRKKFEQVIITESIEEYELLQKVHKDKKHVNFMKRYEQILKAEHKKISDFNRSLISSNSWKITKFLRIKK